MKKQMKKQMLSLVVSAAMTASMMPKPALAADNTTFPDMPNDWSTQALQNAINNGLLNGIDGKIAAGENLTRAQMAAIVTRAFGTNGKADISSFGDVNTGDWFYDAMASSVLMGAIQGDGVNLNPNADITRQEAFTVLARLFTLSGGDQSVLNSYTDGDQVADWAKDSMASMVAAGYVKGFDNKLNPQDSITRAEFAQVMDNLVKTYFGDSQLNVNAGGNAVLNKAGTLEGATISGDLIIGDGAAEGDVVLKNVTVSGRLLVRGGGTSTVTLEGNTTVGGVTVNKPTGAVRVENNAEKAVNVNAVSDNVVLTGDFAEVNANAAQGTVTLTGATVATMNVAGASAKVVVAEKSTVETMNVQGSASGAAVSVQSGTTVKTMNTAASKAVVTVNGTVSTMSVSGSDTTVKAEEGAKIEKVTTSAANTTVSGKGSVTNFEAAQGSSGASITTDGTKVTNNGTGDVTTGNDKVISSGSTGTSQSDSTTPGGGGSTGGGGGSSTPSVTTLTGQVSSQSADNKIFGVLESAETGVAIDADNEIPAGVSDKVLTQEQISALGGSGDYRSLTLYVQLEGTLPTFTKITQKYMQEDGTTLATMNAKTNTKDWTYTAEGTGDLTGKDNLLNKEDGRYATQDGKTYLKLALYAFSRPSEGSTWGLISPDAAKQVLEFYNGETLVAKLTVDSPLNGYCVNDPAEHAKAELAKIESALAEGVTVTGTATTEKVKAAVDAKISTVEGYTVNTSVGSAANKDGTWAVTVTVTNSTTESDTVTKTINVTVNEDTEETVSTVDALKTALTNKDVLTVTVASDLGKLSENLEVPADKTLVIGKGGKLDAYDAGLSGEGAVVVQGGTLKINANYNGDTDSSKLPTIATIQVNYGGTLASMTTKVGEEADTKFVGPDADARIQTTEGASVTFGFREKPTMTISGDVTIPVEQTWYSMFDSGEDAIGISMTQKSGTMTVNGDLKIVSANKTGSSLTINEGASVLVNGTMSVAAHGTVTNNGTIENNGTIQVGKTELNTLTLPEGGSYAITSIANGVVNYKVTGTVDSQNSEEVGWNTVADKGYHFTEIVLEDLTVDETYVGIKQVNDAFRWYYNNAQDGYLDSAAALKQKAYEAPYSLYLLADGTENTENKVITVELYRGAKNAGAYTPVDGNKVITYKIDYSDLTVNEPVEG